MTLRLPVVMAGALLLCGGVRADEGADWTGGFVLGGQEAVHLQTTPLNAGNFLGIPRRRTTLAALLEGRYRDITWRTRVELRHTDIDGDQTGYAAAVQELNRVFALSPDVTLSVGKRLYALDPAFVNQPLGFLQKRTDLGDPLDTLGQSEGLPMVVLSWTGARASAAAIYSKDARRHADGYNRGVEQAIVRLGYEFDQLSASVLLRRADGESRGAGLALSGAVGDSLSWYGSAYTALGTQRPILPALLALGAGDPVPGPWRADDSRRYTRATVGMTWAFAALPKLQLEYAYDGRGLSDGQFAAMQALIERNIGLPLPEPVRQGLQAQVAQMLTSQGARRRYLSVSLAQTAGDWELGGGVYVGQDDRSKVWHGTADYRYSSRVMLMFSALRQSGAATTERGLSPLGGNLAARLRWVF